MASKAARALLRSFVRDVRRALADPAAEQARDIWDLAVFGHRGWLDFAGITQPWLREAAKRWAAQDLARRRGKGHSNVRIVITPPPGCRKACVPGPTTAPCPPR